MTTTYRHTGNTKVVVTLDDTKTRRVFIKAADLESKKVAGDVLDAAQREAPVGKTGALRRGLLRQQSRDVRGRWSTGWEVVSTAPHTLFVVKGTRPHKIEGRPLLAFFWPKVGRNVVFRSVQHPGTKPNDFLTRALRSARRGVV